MARALLLAAGALTLGQAEVYHATPADGVCDCIRKAARPGDECRLHAGRYQVGPDRCTLSGLHGTEAQPIIIASAGDGPVILDGTIAIEGPWEKTASGHWAASSGGHDILQLFDESENMQVLARYPNARWSDKSVFYGVTNWFRSASPGVHNLETGEGLLRDTGACKDQADCCAQCNANDLAASGINATGALAVLNVWSCDTGVQRITRHDANNPGVLHYEATWVGLCDEYRGGDGRYFLEGLLSFLDTPEEWLFDNVTKKVLTASKPTATYRGRVSDYAIVVSNASFLHFVNLSFHATTLSVAGDVRNIIVSSTEFNYSAVSRRSLGDPSPPVTMNLWRDQRLQPSTAANFLLNDVAVRYSDGPALMLSGDKSTLQDCSFEWNDWTTVGGSWPEGVPRHGKGARATTLRTQGDGLQFLHLTFRNNGAAQCFSAGGSNLVPAHVEMCSFDGQLSSQDDGSFVEGGGTPSTVYVRNWGTNTGKAGLRWDGYYPGTLGGLMLQNVVWNASAIVVKGDQHNVTANTVFDGADIGPTHAAHNRPRYQDHMSSLDDLTILSAHIGAGTKKYDPRANNLTTFTRNVFDKIGIRGKTCPHPPCTLPGTYIQNLIGTTTPFDIRAELRDPYHRDFRPCPGSQVANMSAGAYVVYTATDSVYWIPGHRGRIQASTPLPPAGAIGVYRNTDLMFLPAVSAKAHSVFLAKAGTSLQKLSELGGDGKYNIARLGGHPLDANTAYIWRVDTHSSSGTTETGPLWTFTTSDGMSCHVTPKPPKPPSPVDCATSEKSACPGQAGKGEACENCVKANSAALEKAGCFKGGSGGRHAFIKAFCGLEGIAIPASAPMDASLII